MQELFVMSKWKQNIKFFYHLNGFIFYFWWKYKNIFLQTNLTSLSYLFIYSSLELIYFSMILIGNLDVSPVDWIFITAIWTILTSFF